MRLVDKDALAVVAAADQAGPLALAAFWTLEVTLRAGEGRKSMRLARQCDTNRGRQGPRVCLVPFAPRAAWGQNSRLSCGGGQVEQALERPGTPTMIERGRSGPARGHEWW